MHCIRIWIQKRLGCLVEYSEVFYIYTKLWYNSFSDHPHDDPIVQCPSQPTVIQRFWVWIPGKVQFLRLKLNWLWLSSGLKKRFSSILITYWRKRWIQVQVWSYCNSYAQWNRRSTSGYLKQTHATHANVSAMNPELMY
jgi:hypothetical protein